MEFIKDFFKVEYGKDNFLGRDTLDNGKTPLISSKGTNRGIIGYVNSEPTYEKVISIPRTGTVCYAFYQNEPCCINSDNIVLIPKRNFSKEEMLFVSLLIRKEIFRYSYGRKVTPKRISLMKFSKKIPKWVKEAEKLNYSNLKDSINKHPINFENNWKEFYYSEIFEIERGFYNKRPSEMGEINFVSASIFNNGITDKLSRKVIKKIFRGNVITIVNNGHAGEAFYQKEDFTCSHDVNIIKPKKGSLNVYLAMFLISIIKKEKYRYNYGRKWRFKRMEKAKIKLPVDSIGNPNWEFMEDYIKSLPYSKFLEN